MSNFHYTLNLDILNEIFFKVRTSFKNINIMKAITRKNKKTLTRSFELKCMSKHVGYFYVAYFCNVLCDMQYVSIGMLSPESILSDWSNEVK